MDQTIALVSSGILREEFVENLKNRKIDQKFFYMGDGARAYYESARQKKKANVNSYLPLEAFANFLRDQLSKEAVNAFVSLGCGNAEQEAAVMRILSQEGYRFAFFGIDSSAEILKDAEAQLASLPPEIGKTLILADLTTSGFREKINDLVRSYDRRVFAFLGSTFGNFNQTNITDSFYNLLSPGDLLWFDVATRPGVTALEDFNLFNRYSAYLKIDDASHFWLAPLLELGVDRGSGVMRLSSDKEPSVGAMKFRFSFVFSRKVVARIGEDVLHFLPGEKIDTQTIRVYHPETLINFFQEHSFSLVKSQIERLSPEISKGQFLFKKSA